MLGYFLMPHPPIIVHEVGKGKEVEVNNTVKACDEAARRIASLKPDTLILITPHGAMFRDAMAMVTERSISGNLAQFNAANVKFNYHINLDLTRKIIKYADEENLNVAALNKENAYVYGVDLELDHGAMVPLYFIEKYGKYKLVHITYGLLSPLELAKFGTVINRAVEDSKERAVLVASGDLSHRLTKDGPYPYTPLGAEFDRELISILQSGKLEGLFNMDKVLVNESGQCGLRSLYVLAGAINSNEAKAELLSYEGPLGVGYGIMEFKGKETNLYDKLLQKSEMENQRRMKEGNPYTILARKNLNSYFDRGTLLSIDDVKDEELLNDKKGVFVSLKINGELRGCIGTIAPVTDTIAEEIIRNSLSAAINDPRFSPLTQEELKEIDISVDLLHEPEKTTFEELNPKEYGVIVSSGSKRGLLLPKLEGIDTSEQQVAIAMEKGNIRPSDNYVLERFKVERFKECEDDE